MPKDKKRFWTNAPSDPWAQLIDVFTALVRLATPKKRATGCVVDIINGLAMMSSGRSICSKIQRERTQLGS